MDYLYFTGDYFADSFIMFDYLSDLELVTGNDRSGTKFFNKKQQSQSTKFGYTWRKRRGNFDREYCPIRKLYKTGKYFLFPILALACKEDVPLYMFGLGVYACLVEKKKKLGLATMAICIIWALVAFVPKFLFSSSLIIEASVYLLGGSVSLSILFIFLTLISSFIFNIGSSSSFSLT